MVDSVNTDMLLRSALRALALRQRAIAANIANVDTPGFRTSDVRFEAALQQAAQQGSGQLKLTTSHSGHYQTGENSTAQDITPEVVTDSNDVLRPDGNNVDIEQQMLRLSETVITFGALSRLASGRLAWLRSALSDGRR